MNVYAINGRFGAYVQLGETPEKGVKEKPKRSSLTGGMTESTVTLDEALKLLELPRELGTHPESGSRSSPASADSARYVKHGDDYRSLERRRRSVHRRSRARAGAARGAEEIGTPAGGAAKRVIRQIEATDGGAALQVLEGRYGPYVTDGETNASIPKGTDPATISLDALSKRARRGAPSRLGAAAASTCARRRRRPGGRPRKPAPRRPLAGRSSKAAAAKRKAAPANARKIH